jgi:DNA-directed RNA polymerase subunit RPC12/RpoP
MQKIICLHCQEEIDRIQLDYQILSGLVLDTLFFEDQTRNVSVIRPHPQKGPVYETDYLVQDLSLKGFFCPNCGEEFSSEDLKKMGIEKLVSKAVRT